MQSAKQLLSILGAATVAVVLSSPVVAQNAAQRAALAQMKVHALTSGLEATSVTLDQPGGLAFDSVGDMFIADTNNNVIREVALNGTVSTVAGTGAQGFGGDGGAATSALLDSPTGVAEDASGNLYIADSHNNRIRMVSGGNISTIAGTGVAGFSGDGGAATAAQLSLPTALAVDSNANIYVADTNNNRIREISGTTIHTVAGDGDQIYSGDGGLATAAGLDSPNGVAVDASFNIYIGDTHNQRIRMVTFSTGIINTLAGTGVKGFNSDGSAATAALARPGGLAVDSSGTVYVADSDNQRIRTVAASQVVTIAGDGQEGFSGDTGTSTSASLDTPRSVAVQGATVSFADTMNEVVRTITASGVDTTAGTPAINLETLTLSGVNTIVYGTGALTANFANGANTASGQVTFYDGLGASPALLGSASFSSNQATLNTSLLSAGTHYIVASFAGDSKNAAITSGVFVLAVTPIQLTALANPVNLLYGQSIPTLTGSLNTVLAQDAGNVVANFTTTATATANPAIYPISVTISGSAAGNYTVVLGSTSGSVIISKAPSNTGLGLSSASTIFGAQETLTATVASTTTGTPAGTVSFYDGTTLLNSTPAAVVGGVAILQLTTLPVGVNSITAVYSGSIDFLTSTSSAAMDTVNSPDFSIAATPSVQAVVPSHSVNYTLTLTPTNPTFVYPVTLSASGMPDGVTATFSPSSLTTGAAASTVTLTLSAASVAHLQKSPRLWGGGATVLALMLPLLFSRRTRRAAQRWSKQGKVLMALVALALLSALAGCGGGGFFSQATQSYTVTVTAVCGPDTHTANVTLTVQ
jgi:hypothetical protein